MCRSRPRSANREAAVAARHVRARRRRFGEKQSYLTIPQTAITYNPYGATVFVTVEKKDAKGHAELQAQQVFITPGPTRGDQVAILKGVSEGATIVTSGQLKLKNGTPLRIDNSVQPLNDAEPYASRTMRGRLVKFTDLFIRRPVLAIVISLLILVLGLRSRRQLAGQPVSAHGKRGRYHQHRLLRRRRGDRRRVHHAAARSGDRAGAGHRLPVVVQYDRISTITATLRLNYDSNRALTEINTQVNSVKNQLPPQAQQPVLTVQVGQTIDAMYMGFYSDTIPTNNVTDYLVRVVKPKLDSLEGVQTAEILGARQFALRAWLDASKLAAHNVTAQDVFTALGNNNYLAAVGSSQGPDGHGGSDRRHRSAYRPGVSPVGDQAGGRLDRASRGCRRGHARRRELRSQRRIQRQALGVHRHQGGAEGEYPERRQARPRRFSGAAVAACRPASPARSSTTRPSSSTLPSPRW